MIKTRHSDSSDIRRCHLGTFGQADLDRWLTDSAGGYRYEAATFIRWAHANKLTTAYLPAQRCRRHPQRPCHHRRDHAVPLVVPPAANPAARSAHNGSSCD
jgi:hypothetical protein